MSNIKLAEMAVSEAIRELMIQHGFSELEINEGYFGNHDTHRVGKIGSEVRKIIKHIYYEFGYSIDGYCGDENCEGTVMEIRKYWEGCS